MHRLILQSLSKSYGGHKVVDDVSMEVKSGEVVGLLGPNGAGKTSTFFMVLGLLQPDGGKIYRINYRDPILDAAARNNQYLASIATLWNLGEQWRLCGEAGVRTQKDRTLDSNSQFAQLAAIWSPNSDTDVALGIKRDFNTGSAVIWTTTLGLTYRFR